MYELRDAHEHLGDLVSQLEAQGTIEAVDYAVQLGHVFAHLNRAWHSRADPKSDELSDEAREKYSKFPTDLDPVG